MEPLKYERLEEVEMLEKDAVLAVCQGFAEHLAVSLSLSLSPTCRNTNNVFFLVALLLDRVYNCFSRSIHHVTNVRIVNCIFANNCYNAMTNCRDEVIIVVRDT